MTDSQTEKDAQFPRALLGYRPATAARGRAAQIVDRLNALSRQAGIAHTAQAKLLQLDARDLAAIIRDYLPSEPQS